MPPSMGRPSVLVKLRLSNSTGMDPGSQSYGIGVLRSYLITMGLDFIICKMGRKCAYFLGSGIGWAHDERERMELRLLTNRQLL